MGILAANKSYTFLVQPQLPIKSLNRTPGHPVDNTKMVIKVAGQEYCVKNDTKKHRKSLSLGSISDFNIEIEKTKIDKDWCMETLSNNKNLFMGNRNKKENEISNREVIKANIKDGNTERNTGEISKEGITNQNKNLAILEKDFVKSRPPKTRRSDSKNQSQTIRQSIYSNNSQKNFKLQKSKSEGNPFRHQGSRKIVDRPKCGKLKNEF